jgi:rhamnosyltransferase
MEAGGFNLIMENKNYCHDISAVLVTYNPNMEALRTTIQAVLSRAAVDDASEKFPSYLIIKR